jgi:hypothetical protein
VTERATQRGGGRSVPPWRRARNPLVPLIRVHSANALADVLVAVSLADTFFFDVPLGEARSRVALYLLITVAPFAVVAPVVGPLLDRLRSGRRYAITATFLLRAVLAWTMAGGDNALRLYPAAFGVLVLSKAYGVTKGAAVPRLAPASTTLVAANGRLSATSIVVATAGGLVGAGVAALAGYRWSLRLAAVAFLVAAAFALALPRAVDSEPVPRAPGSARSRPGRFAGRARWALIGAASLRGLSGFLTMFLAFLLRQDSAGAGGTARLGVVLAAAAVGGMAGTVLGVRLPDRAPEVLIGGALGAAALTAGLAATSFSLPTAAAMALVSGLTNALAKLAYDAVLQQDVPEDVRGQTFARSETTLQLAWVFGGVLGIVLPLRGGLGLGIAAVGLGAATVAVVRGLRSSGGVARPAVG